MNNKFNYGIWSSLKKFASNKTGLFSTYKYFKVKYTNKHNVEIEYFTSARCENDIKKRLQGYTTKNLTINEVDKPYFDSLTDEEKELIL